MNTFNNTRPLRRPRTRWKDEIQKECMEMGITNLEELAKGRTEWKRLDGTRLALKSTQKKQTPRKIPTEDETPTSLPGVKHGSVVFTAAKVSNWTASQVSEGQKQ
ncbi:hypothetical protein ANN_05282 [Periplaneta americana]|uniref:Uncharacterized protein n=1 Tax=Periplaneta americana TaxID=6978 RepID=A0ABQ8TAQ8_PERAM|nr:hypothetical protein ANN_05282 [Periplaneta americana]